MNKEQSADDPSVDLIRVKYVYTISMSYLERCNCMYRTYVFYIQSNWGSVGEARDNNMKDTGGWLITITANHSNYLAQDRANTQSVTVRKRKTATVHVHCPRN